MSEELEVLKTVTGRLDAAAIPYMVTGSMAANYYAVPRMTRDIDLVVEVQERHADRLVELFQDQFYVDGEMVREAVLKQSMFNLIHLAFVIKVDMVVRKASEYRLEEFSRRRLVSVEGHAFQIVAPEDLILSKLEWAKDSRSSPTERRAQSTGQRVRPGPLLSGTMGRLVGGGVAISRGRGMRDTSPEMEERFRAMLLARSGEERLKMGCSMHVFAQQIVRASVLAQAPQTTADDLRRAMFLRFYGSDFDEPTREKILSALK